MGGTDPPNVGGSSEGPETFRRARAWCRLAFRPAWARRSATMVTRSLAPPLEGVIIGQFVSLAPRVKVHDRAAAQLIGLRLLFSRSPASRLGPCRRVVLLNPLGDVAPQIVHALIGNVEHHLEFGERRNPCRTVRSSATNVARSLPGLSAFRRFPRRSSWRHFPLAGCRVTRVTRLPHWGVCAGARARAHMTCGRERWNEKSRHLRHSRLSR